MKRQFKVDRILKKIKVLEGIVYENVLHSKKEKYSAAYDKYSLFKNERDVTDLYPRKEDNEAEENGETKHITFQNIDQSNILNDD